MELGSAKVANMLRAVHVLCCQLVGAWRLTANMRSFFRLAVDFLLCKVLLFVRLPSADRERRIRLVGGVELVYRLNRGDIWALYEVWVLERHRPPIDIRPNLVIDLGANIGLTSLYFVERYGASRVLMVEPSLTNARLAQSNLSNSGVAADVLSVAVGPNDGAAPFLQAEDSTNGRVDFTNVVPREVVGINDECAERMVPVMSMASVMHYLPEDATVDIVKIDIEGAEHELLTGDLSWLQRVRSLIVEFHLAHADRVYLIALLRESGFRCISTTPDSGGVTAQFVRPD